MSVRAVSIDELTGGGPIVVFAPTIADACLACGAMLTACFAHRGALLVTTLAATSPAWMAAPARATSSSSRHIVAGSRADDDDERAAAVAASPGRPTRFAGGDGLLAPLVELGGTAGSVKALAIETVVGGRIDRARPDRTSQDIAELCLALGVRSLFLPLTPHRASRHLGAVEAAVLRVQAADDRVRTWRCPTAWPGSMEGRGPGPELDVRMLDTTPWREPKRRALARMVAAGFGPPPTVRQRVSGNERPASLAAEPERYLRDARV